MGVFCGCVCGSVTTTNRNCVHRGCVGKCSDHLKIIKFWPSRAPGKGSAAGRKFSAPLTIQPARNVCGSSGRFYILVSMTFLLFTAGRGLCKQTFMIMIMIK